MSLVRTLGCLLVVAGLVVGLETLIALGFATMIDPALDQKAWWAEYWSKIWRHGLVVMGLLALVLVGLGSRLLLVQINTPLPPHQDDQLRPIGAPQRLKDWGERDEFF